MKKRTAKLLEKLIIIFSIINIILSIVNLFIISGNSRSINIISESLQEWEIIE